MMSIEFDSEEDEHLTLIENTVNLSPARKKRRLNNNKSQRQKPTPPINPIPYQLQSPSSEETRSDSDREEKSHTPNSDKENTYQINVRNGKKRNRSQLHNAVYKFGNQRYDIPLTVNPGALVRLELINFLCHENFAISFHPCVNIIYGQNGSGKSAVEAGISMALGQNSKKTGRGAKISDVIKDGTDFAVIKLYLYNSGPEALPEYGPEIVIERKLTRTAKGGNSYFKVYDGSTLKAKGTGLKAVRAIANKFNLNVDNPCVVLKQSVAKEFLNSTKNGDKFRFFMQASKLGNFVSELNEARENVRRAIQNQKQTKGSFVAIRDQFFAVKQQLETVEKMEETKGKITFWARSEKWMIYHKERVKSDGFEQGITVWKSKIESSKRTLTEQKQKMKERIERLKVVKSEIEEKTEHIGRHDLPVNRLKNAQTDLDKGRSAIVRKMNAKQKYIDKKNANIKALQREYNECLDSIQNNERGRQLAAIQKNLKTNTEKLSKLRNEREPLRGKAEKTIEMKDNEQRLNQCKNELYHKTEECKELNSKLDSLQRRGNNRSEQFLHPTLRRRGRNNGNNISVRAIHQCIRDNQRRFGRQPIGPLGEYVNLRMGSDANENNRNIQIVQTVLRNSMYVFLVDSSRDMQTFKQIMYAKFQRTVPCIQYKHSNRMEQINANPFLNHQSNNDRDGPLIRVSDMFSIKDNNAWIYNAILVNSAPERVYAYGDLPTAKNFIKNLDSHRQRQVNSVMTYRERNGLYMVQCKRGSVAGTPQSPSDPILQTDSSKQRQYFQTQLNEKIQSQTEMKRQIAHLSGFVKDSQRKVRESKKRFDKCVSEISKCERNIDRLERQQRDLSEEEEDNNESGERLKELQNEMNDEQSEIEGLKEEIAPFEEKRAQLLRDLSANKSELNEIERVIVSEKHSIDNQRRNYDGLLAKSKKLSKTLQAIPRKIAEMEGQMQSERDRYEREKERIDRLRTEAADLGSEVSAKDYPRNRANRDRVFTVDKLRRARQKLEAEIEEWENDQKNHESVDEIRRRFEAIKPKYLHHQSKVDSCNFNCDEMNRLLHHRRKNYERMKEQVKEQLSLQFRLTMRAQGHEGSLTVDYENETLEMLCRMAGHGGNTQVRNSKTLSGGERSFTQVALIMALQKFSGSPMCIYDEFDVFMDSVNRGNSIKILLSAALGGGSDKGKEGSKKGNHHTGVERQYIFITPNDVSPIIAQGYQNQIRIHKLKPPRRH